MTTIMFLFLLICSQNFKSCKELWVPITKGTLNLTGLEENNNGSEGAIQNPPKINIYLPRRYYC